MLARFAALSKQAEEEKRAEEEEKKRLEDIKRIEQEKEEQSQAWIHAMKGGDHNKNQDEMKYHDCMLKKVDKADLVWAPIQFGFKGTQVYAMSRICPHGEAALCSHVVWPIPDDHILVEHFSLPSKNFNRYEVIPPTKKQTSTQRIFPFNAPIKKSSKQITLFESFDDSLSSSSEHDQWDPDRIEAFRKALKDKYNSLVANEVTEKCLAVANAFLNLANEKKHDEELYEEAREDADKAIQESREILKASIDASGDMAKYALKSTANSQKETGKKGRKRKSVVDEMKKTLSAGDYIGYQCKIFKESRKSQIIRIDPLASNPITLANDDIIYITDLIVKHSGPEDASEEDLYSCPLSEFSLEKGKIDVESTQRALARQTKSDLRAIERETGVSLNTSRRKKWKASLK